MNQRNQELTCLERGAFSFHFVSALSPCPELNLLLLSGKEGAEGRQESYPLVTGYVLVKRSVRFGYV